MIRKAVATTVFTGLMALASSAAIVIPAPPASAMPTTQVPSVLTSSWGNDLAAAGLGIKVAQRARDVEALEGAVNDAIGTLDRLSQQPKGTRDSVAAKARALQSTTAVGAVTSYLMRVKDCKANSLARMAGIAKRVRDNKATLAAWIDPGERKWLNASLAELDRRIPACQHLTLTFDSYMTLEDPKWEIAGQFEVPLDFKMDASGKPYWAGRQTGIVENVKLANADGCTWTVDPTPFSFEVSRLELDFNSILGITNDVNLKQYSTDVTMVDTATAVCPDNSPPPTPIWGWSMIFADMRGFLTSGTWPTLSDWRVPDKATDAEMFKVLKGTTSSTGFTEASIMFLYRR